MTSTQRSATIQDRFKGWCVTLGLWLLRRGGFAPLIVPTAVLPLIPLVKRLCDQQDATAAPGTSGEYKRHVVYAAAIKEFETRGAKPPRRLIALAIELAML